MNATLSSLMTALALFGALILSACSDTDPAQKSDNINSFIVISDARIRAPLPGQKIAVAYFTLDSMKDDRLLAVTSPISQRVELHTHIEDDGIIRMRRVNDAINIPAGQSIVFQQGGLHVMLFDVTLAPDRRDVSLTFDFEISDDVTIIADIITHDSYGSGDHGSGGHGSGTTKGEGEGDKSYGSDH